MKIVRVLGGEWVLLHTDQALGDDARRIQVILDSAEREDRSVSVGEKRRLAQHALTKLWLDGLSGGGVRVAGATLRYAREFLDALPDYILSILSPEIYADTDGEVIFDWDLGRRWVFTVSIGPDGTLTYAGLLGHRRAHGTEVLAGSIPRGVAEKIALVAEKATSESSSTRGATGAIPLSA